jgi:hypothetical protein
MCWDGSLAYTLELALLDFNALLTDNFRLAFAEFIAAVSLSFSGLDLCTGVAAAVTGRRLPDGGLISLLGPNGIQRIRECMEVILHVKPSCAVGPDLAYHNLRDAINSVLLRNTCSCSSPCFSIHVWGDCRVMRFTWCPVARFWITLGDIITRAIASLFVLPGPNACIRESKQAKKDQKC